MGKTALTPINGVIEPDFLEYLARTFDRWQKLPAQEVTLGTREIAKFEDVLLGAKLNSRYGFEIKTTREVSDEDGMEHYTVLIHKKQGTEKEEKPLFTFDTPIYR